MPYTVKEYNQVVEAKKRIKELWVLACANDGIDPTTTCVIFSNSNPAAVVYNTAMGAYFDLVKRIKKNKARRDRHATLTDLGLKCVKGSLGGVYYE